MDPPHSSEVTPDDLKRYVGVGDDLFMDLIRGEDPALVLEGIVTLLHSLTNPDEAFVLMVGIGPLETLLHRGHGDALWPRIEELARNDILFRQALGAAWAYESPEFDRRVQLLDELGEQFRPDPPLSG